MEHVNAKLATYCGLGSSALLWIMYQSVIRQIEKTYEELGAKIDTLKEQRVGLLRSLGVCHQRMDAARDSAPRENLRIDSPAAPRLVYFPKSVRP
jgi:hypothetical protein